MATNSSGNEATDGVVEMRDRLQAQLGDALRILEVLGAHGAEYLLRAQDVERGTEVVVRAFVVDPDKETKELWDFERRAEAAARLDHPNITAAGPLQRRDTLAYYVSTDIKESTVESLLSSGALRSVEHIFAILHDIAAALDYAHAQGVVHGHLDPSSIMLRGNDIASVANFGARSGAPPLRGRWPAYMAPEQWQLNPTIDGRADIYALGVIAFELLSGRMRSLSPSVQGIAIVDPLPLKQDAPLRPGVGLHVNQAILRAVSKRASARFATAGEFVATIASRSQPEVQSLPTERPELVIERNPHFALAPMLLVIVLGIGVGAVVVPSARRALRRIDAFSSITSGIDLRIPELPAFSDAPLARRGRTESSDSSSTDGFAASSDPIFPSGATDPGTTHRDVSPVTGERSASTDSKGGESPIGASGETSSTSEGALQPSTSAESGFLRVEFDGPAALVMVDEVPRGRTPFVERVASGVHTVRLVGARSSFPLQQVRVFGGDTALASFSAR